MQKLFITLVLLTLSGCSNPQTREVKLHLQIAKPEASLNDLSRARAATSATPPSSVSNFACLAVNVVGPKNANGENDIPSSDPTRFPKSAINAMIDSASPCFYPGITSHLIDVAALSENIELDLTIPAGPDRIIQILGIPDIADCSDTELGNLIAASSQPHQDFPDLIEVGRARTDITEDVIVAVPNIYDSANPRYANCYSPSAFTVYPDPLYFAATEWNDYVDMDTNAACIAGTSTHCRHGGEAKKIEMGDFESCEGLSATDDLGAFNWLCDDESETEAFFFSEHLNEGKGLSDLINPLAWKNNAVTVRLHGNIIATSPSYPWWTNPFSLVSGSTGPQTLNTEGTIYTINSNISVDGFNIDADKVALVVTGANTATYADANAGAPNCSLATGETSGADYLCLVSAGSNNFLWIEGSFNAESGTANSQIGIYLNSVRHSTIAHTVVSDAVNDGIKLDNSDRNTLLGSHVLNNMFGIYLDQSDGNDIFHIEAEGNTTDGLMVDNSLFTRSESIIAHSNGNYGVNINSSDSNEFYKVTAANNGSHGIRMANSDDNRFQHLDSYNNGNHGIYLTGSNDSVFVSTQSISNYDSGIRLLGADNNIFSQINANNNGNEDGIYIGEGSQENTFVQTVASNNFRGGLHLDGSNNNFFYYLTATHNDYGLLLGDTGAANSNILQGDFSVGSNSTIDCNIISGTGNNISSACSESDPDLNVNLGTDITSSYVGLVTSDSVNANNTIISTFSGLVIHPNVTDWVNFESFFRTWGRGATTSTNWSHNTNRNSCITGTCSPWDWSLAATDTELLDVLPCPGAEDFITHTRSDTSVFNFLRGATEIYDDEIGDDDGLCESNEECRYTPNLGAYQGHGERSDPVCGNIGTGGSISAVNLYSPEFNGY